MRKIESLYPWYRRILFDRSILSIVRDIGYCALLWFHRIVTFQCATRTTHHESSCFLSVCHARTHFRERSSNLLYHQHHSQPFFRTMDRFFHMRGSFWRYFVSKYSEREKVRARKRRNERKTQLPRLSGIFPWGNYILLQFDLSSALSRGRKRRHGLTLFSKRVTPDFSTDSRYFSFHAFYYFYSTVVATRNITIDVSAKEPGGKRGDAFLRQFITRVGSRNLFEHLIYHSWNVNWYLKTRYILAIFG